MIANSKTADPRPAEDEVLGTILGYLNFSRGLPDTGVQRALNCWWEFLERPGPWCELRDRLLEHLQVLRSNSAAFADSEQAEVVIRLVFDECLPAYQNHHADLLVHLSDEDFRQPFFLARVCEAVLSQGDPWSETQRIVGGALEQLNDYLGHRPLAVLENDRRMQPYQHERCRPVPLYIRGAGVAVGKYQALLERTIRFFQETPDDVLSASYFDLSCLDELAIDVRAHDHEHPMNKRTNYMFGEWDPHQIDNKGQYRRFVVRKIILDLLLQWMQEFSHVPDEELLYDASATLCGTMLMASSVSGSGPQTHDSSVTLTSLLPKIARQRDAFYARLLDEMQGIRSARLRREAELTQQPFGHVRQYLNMQLAKYGARQVQNRHLAQLFARMGFPEASRQQASLIPAASMRFECEMRWRITAANLDLDHGQLDGALQRIAEVEDLLQRGIQCGAIVDPWNILGFQELFPLFNSREDSIPDQRVETLLGLMEDIFGVYSRALGEAAAQGDAFLSERISTQFQKLADDWDHYATTTVETLPPVSGGESWESARHVSQTLVEWRSAGEAAGDISFWRQKVDRFQSAKSYALVVEALLEKRDLVASMGLLMQWLNRAEEVGLESGAHSIFPLLVRWMQIATQADGEDQTFERLWPTVRRLFDYLESNAGPYWSVSSLEAAFGIAPPMVEEAAFPELYGENDGGDDDVADVDDEDQLFQAAYENVVYHDSADDGQRGDTLDDGYDSIASEIGTITRFLEPRLKFLDTLAQLWQMAAAAMLSSPERQLAGGLSPKPEPNTSSTSTGERAETLRRWLRQTAVLETDLTRLTQTLDRHEIPTPVGELDESGEYGAQLQEKFELLNAIISTHVRIRNARRCLLCCVPSDALNKDLVPEGEELTVEVCRAVFSRDAAQTRKLIPKLIKSLFGRPLLYVPLDNGGRPEKVRHARHLQSTLQFLLTQLPRLGLLRETWRLLKTAYRMERASRPRGPAVTEFDRLFRTALQHSLKCVIYSVGDRRSDSQREAPLIDDVQLIEIISAIITWYDNLWLQHSATTRLSSVEKLDDETVWSIVKEFIEQYGADLFHARMLLPPGKIRAILHHGVEKFLDDLAEHQDPLQPLRLLEDLETATVDRDDAIDCLEVIYESILDGLERFLEYNTTTTQSDYGEMFYCLLDFLRVEAAYERDAWNMSPAGIAHELLAGHEQTAAARIWEKIYLKKTGDMAERHLAELGALEKVYGMRMPSIADRLNERFIKPLSVNRMLALVPLAMQEARSGRLPSQSFELLRSEIDAYLTDSSGSGLEAPGWLRSLESTVDNENRSSHADLDPVQQEMLQHPVQLTLNQLRSQLSNWDGSQKKKRTRKKRPKE